MKRLLHFVTLLFLTLLIGIGGFHDSTVHAATAFSVSTNSVNPGQLVFSAVGGGNSQLRTVSVTNTSGGSITVNATLNGTNPSNFTITGGASLNLSSGASGNVSVRFAATSNGVYSANLALTSGAETENIELRGLRFPSASGGNDEPSFQRVLNTYNFAVNSGDPNDATTGINDEPANSVNDDHGGSIPLLGDEIAAQTFEKAGAGPVQVQLLGNFLQDKTPDAGTLGWYSTAAPNTLNSIFTVNAKSGSPTNNNHQSLQTVTSPAGPNFSFDPGSAVFGMYGRYTKFVGGTTDRFGYSEDYRNTWDTMPEMHKMRVYPLRMSNGALVPNAYIVTTEDYDIAFDFNDFIFILRNVKPAGAGTADTDPVVRLESRDWTTFIAQNIPLTDYWKTQLIMGKVATSLGTPPNRLRNKETSTLRIFNDGGSPLIVSGLTISNTALFSLPNGETSINIPAGGFYDLTVKFIEPGQGTANIHEVRKEKLTLLTNVGTYEVDLRGGFQNSPENSNELTAKQVIDLTNLLDRVDGNDRMGGFKSIASMAGESWYAAGAEVLSKYWKIADPTKPIYLRQLATLQGCCTGALARLDFDNTTTNQDPRMTSGQYFTQSVVPPHGSYTSLDGEIIIGAPTELLTYNTNRFEFLGPGLSGGWNRACDGFENVENGGSTPGCGMVHGIRWWAVRDAQGWMIPGTFFVVQDYTGGGGNYDYNDNMYLITNVQPVVEDMHPSIPISKRSPDLMVTAASDPANSRVGRTTTVRFTVRNVQSIGASNVNMTINLPGQIELVSAAGCTGTGPLTCSLNNFIAGDIRFVDVVMKPLEIGDKVFSATVTSSTTEVINSNNSTSLIVPVGVQTAPTAVNDSYEMVQDTALSVNKNNGVLSNDTDPNTDPLTASLVDLPDHAIAFNLKPNGSFTYTPTVGYIGTDTFTYVANDGSDDSEVATVTIEVNRFNYVPVTQDDDYTTPEDTPLVVNSANGILANDSDGNSDPLTISIIDQPTHATSLTVNPNGSFTYVPAASYFGLDTFTYRVNDGEADSNISTVTITVTSVGDVPVANDDSYNTDENVTLTVNSALGLLKNDTDGDGDVLKVDSNTQPASGTLTVNPNGSFTYIPQDSFKGQVTFTYTVTDNKDGTDTATVTINVAPENSAPTVVADKYNTYRDETLIVEAEEGVLANDTDDDDDELTAQLVSAPAGVNLTLNSNGGFTYVPNNGFEGDVVFSYRALDGNGGSAIGLATISVGAPPVTPSDLIYNGGFEQKRPQSSTMPQGWTTQRLTADKLKCNTNKKTFAYAGQCAFQFVGAANKNTVISQRPNIDIVEEGDTLRLSLFAKGNKVPKDKAVMKVVIKYMDSNLKNDVLNQKLPKQTYGYTSFVKEILVKDDVNWVKVQISYKGAKGTLLIDNVSLRVIKPGVQYTTVEGSLLRGTDSVPVPGGSGQDGLIPLPAAPQDMRGN